MRLSLILNVFAFAGASLTLSNTFGSFMTLQHDEPIPIWGWADVGASIQVTLGPLSGATTVGTTDGFWRIVLAPLQPSFNPITLNATSNQQTISLTNILIGDVFLCSGQSNMEFTVADVINATTELAAANSYPFIRVTSGPLQGKLDLHTILPTPYKNLLAVDLPWSVANNETIGGVGGSPGWDFFSAACWFTLKNIADQNAARGAAIPLGGIVQCYGGTSIQWWSSPAALASCPAANGSSCCNYGGNSSCLYNAQIAPLLLGPTSLAGFLWYQGEQNAGCGGPAQIDYYSCALPALISDWRTSFGNPNLTFGIFLLAAWGSEADSFPLLRLVQVNASIEIPNVFIANNLDQGQPIGGGPVHSPYKQAGGVRAALAMQALRYGQPTQYRGPRYAAATVQGSSVVISFEPESLYGASLTLDPTVGCPSTLPIAACEDFAVQTGEDCMWHSVFGGNVSASLTGGGAQLQLTLHGSGSIVATRGFFANWPLVQLRGGANALPAEPWLANATTGVGCAPPPPREDFDAVNHA